MIIPEIKNTIWKKIGTWETPFLEDCMIVRGTNQEFFSKLGFFKNWYSASMYLEGSLFVTANDFRQFYEEEYQGYLKEGLKYFIRIQELMKDYALESFAFSEKLQKVNLERLSNSELQKLFSEFEEIIAKVMVLGEVIQPLDWIFKEILVEQLGKYLQGKSETEINRIIANLTSPKGNLAVVNERIELLEIAKEIDSNPQLKRLILAGELLRIQSRLKKEYLLILQKISAHQREHSWMANCNWHLSPFSFEYYLKRIKEILNQDPNAELEKITQNRRLVQLQFDEEMNNIHRFGINIDGLIEIIRSFITTKMDNWNTVSICGNRCLPLFEELSHRCELTLKQFFLSTPTEISQRLSGKKLSLPTSPKRGVVRFGNKIIILTSDESKETNLFVQRVGDLNQVKGQVVYSGKVQGEVVVIKTMAEFGKMKKDDILVCPMTNPDFVQLLHKAKAIVTDQGGILCHAAIVSREFKLPCIVGTEIATKVFKDGDLVEVDAEKGIVRRVK